MLSLYCMVVFQMTSSDKDFRFMATNDLMAELQKDSIKLDDDSERKVVLAYSFTGVLPHVINPFRLKPLKNECALVTRLVFLCYTITLNH